MIGWAAFILGLFIIAIAGAHRLGYSYCLLVAASWYILLLRAMKRKKTVSR